MQKQTAKNEHAASGTGVNPVVAGAVGAVVGATAAFFMDQKNRQKALDAIEGAVKKARETADDARKIATDALSDLESKMDDAKQTGREIRAKAQDAAEDTRKRAERAMK